MQYLTNLQKGSKINRYRIKGKDRKGECLMKKMIAPVVVTILLVIYFILYFGVFISFIKSTAIKIVFGAIPVVMSVVLIFVCIQRIKEIRSGEEDDLSKY